MYLKIRKVLRWNYISKYFKVAFFNLTIQSLFGYYFKKVYSKGLTKPGENWFFLRNRKQDVYIQNDVAFYLNYILKQNQVVIV